MKLERVLYVSSLVDEYGFALAPLMASLGRNNLQDEISSLTLFSNGNVMQMLEGPVEQLREAFAHLRAEPVHFEQIVLMQKPIALRSIQGTQLGLKKFTKEVGKTLPAWVDVFALSANEIARRVQACEAFPLLLEFEGWS